MWKITRASVAGTSHAGTGAPCQDSCFATERRSVDGAETLVCLVADGAGSAAEGGRGAELACLTGRSAIEATLDTLDVFKPRLEEGFVGEWLGKIRAAIAAEAAERSLSPRDFACTLVGAVLRPDSALFFQIGDGAIVASTGGPSGVVFWPEVGHHYANMTYFVTDDDAVNNVQIVLTASRIDEVAVFSDGLQRLALVFDQRIPHAPFFASMLKVLRRQNPFTCDVLDAQLATFLNSSQVNERTDDDKTLILATSRS